MKRALVTGANRGLGLETCRQLHSAGWHVMLAARDARAGQEAARALNLAHVEPVQLDVTDAASIARLVQAAREREPLDALVHNAAVLHHGISASIARETLDVNYHGVVRLTDALLPLLAPSANLVMVSSGMGELSGFGEGLQERLTDPALRRRDLDELAEECLCGVTENSLSQRGFPRNLYSVSKALLNGFVRVLARELESSGRRVIAVCPGWVRTRMGGTSAPRTVEEGARGIVWAATLGEGGPRSGFFRDGKPIAW